MSTVAFLTASVSRQAGGLFPVVRQLAAQAALTHGSRIQIFGLEDSNAQDDRSAWKGISLNTVPVRGPHAFGYAPELTALLLASDPDVVHQHGIWMYPSVACARWAQRAGRPYVVSPHGMLDPWALQNSAWKKRLARWFFQDSHLRGATCIHALCQAEAHAIRTYGLTNPICVVPNGVDLPTGETIKWPTWRLELPTDSKVLLFLGRLHPKKGLPALLKGWASATSARQKQSEWHLVIGGWDQGGHEADLKRLCRQDGIENVSFVGPLFDIAKDAAFLASDAFVLPSLSEGLPVTILEAWSYKLPVLMTPHCNLPEGFAAGAAIPTEASPDSIAAGLKVLFDMTESDRHAMGERGWNLVRQQFSWPKIAAQMKKVYEWVLGGGSKPEGVITA